MAIDTEFDARAAEVLQRQPVEARRAAGELDATCSGTPLLPDDEAYMAGWRATIAAIEATPPPGEREVKWGQGDTRSDV